MKQRIKKLTASFLAFLMILTCSYTDVSAAATDYVYVEGTYLQTECRSMLKMINEFRQDSDQAWVWDESNSKKEYYSGLKALQYDYTLEEMAMQRAAEIAVAYSHTRPTGQDCFSIYDEYGYSWMSIGENIAAGYSSASDVFEGWKEENEPYSGQGHRRNMLSSDHTHIGIAGVKVGGTKYWVQVFAQPGGTPNTTKTSACDTTKKVKVAVDTSALTTTVTTTPTSLSLKVGEKADLPSVTVKVKHADSWPSSGCNVTTDYSWSYSGSGASISGNQISGTVEGTGTLKTTILGKAVSVPVTVKDGEPISGCTITLGTTSYVYDGNAKTPSVTVKNGSTTLKKGTDYTVEYKNNTNAGTATAVITGTGDYKGTVEKTFTITKAAQKLTAAKKELHLEKQESAAISISGNQGALSFSSSNPQVAEVTADGKVTGKNYGDAVITVTAAETENYKQATMSISVYVEKPSLSQAEITLSETEYTYTGEKFEPSVTVSYDGKALVKDQDYTVTYSDNINAGTAVVAVYGMGEYGGTVKKTFTIKKAANKITASSQKKVYSTSKRTFSLNAKRLGSAKLTYKSSNKKITVSSVGKVTVPAKFIGKATITITAASTKNYNKAEKKITFTVNPTGTSIKALSNPSAKKMKITWKKNSVGTGYQIMYATNADFTQNKTTKLISKNGTLSATYNVTKGKTYYAKIRTYKTVNGVKYYSGWSAIKQIKIKK